MTVHFIEKRQQQTWYGRNFETCLTLTVSNNSRTDVAYTPGLFTSNMCTDCTAGGGQKKTTTDRRAALPTVDQSYCTCSPFEPIAEGQCSERSQSLNARTTDATEMQQTEQNNKLHCKSNSFTPKQYEDEGGIKSLFFGHRCSFESLFEQTKHFFSFLKGRF